MSGIVSAEPAERWCSQALAGGVCSAGTVSITVGDGGNLEGVSNTFVDEPGECTALTGGAYYFPRE